MWEAANDFLIERNEKRAEFFDAGQLASAELHFEWSVDSAFVLFIIICMCFDDFRLLDLM